MSTRNAVIVAGLAMLVGTPAVADACSCLEPSLSRSWHEMSDTFKVEVLNEKAMGDYRFYEAKVIRSFNGCTRPGDWIRVESNASSASCGMDLRVGQTWLLTASDDDIGDFDRGFQIDLCGYNRPWDQVTDADKAFLESRPITCAGNANTFCADGTVPVACFADPCSVEECSAEATCESNTCGGCTAEFYGTTWEPVCTPW